MQAEILIDYLTFTIHGDANVRTVIDYVLGMDSTIFEHGRGYNFYQQSMIYKDIRVMYEGMSNMGVCVNMSGRGCRAFEEYHNNSILTFLGRIINQQNINITRIDIACDDKHGYLNLEKMMQYANNGLYRTRLMSRNNQESFKGKERGSKTLYFGSANSLYRIRIYDKAKQTGDNNSHWVRFEITLRAEYANQAVKILNESDCLGKAVSGIIKDKFTFIELDNANISRCSVAEWWAEFLGEIQTVKLTSRQKVTHSIDESKKWLKESCGRIITKVYDAIGEDAFNREILMYGRARLTPTDKVMIKDYICNVRGAGHVS